MRLRQFIPLVLIFSALGGLWAQAACADAAAALYDPSTVVVIDLELTPQAESELEAEPDQYVAGNFSLTKTTDGTPAGEEPAPAVDKRPVEVRLKGSVGGSFRDLTEKAAFKLKFKKANAVFGLRKMTLNNMVQDPSMVHETLAYAAFRATGCRPRAPASPTVRVNGNDFGVYLDLENLDDIGLTRTLRAPFDDEVQHLYEGERGAKTFSRAGRRFRNRRGPDHRGDLEALVTPSTAQAAPPSPSASPPCRPDRDGQDVGGREVHRPLGRLRRTH